MVKVWVVKIPDINVRTVQNTYVLWYFYVKIVNSKLFYKLDFDH